MTGSRARPVKGRMTESMGEARGNASVASLPIGLSEMPVEVGGFSLLTPQASDGGQRYRNMHHKLHLVLRDLLKMKGQSARKAAKACGVPLSTFNGYLKPDRHQIDPNHLLTMARYFDVSLDYLLSGKESEKRIEGLPTRRLFSRWVKLTIEEIAGEDELELFKGGKK